MKRIGIVNVNLEYEIPKNYKGTAREFLQDVELPEEYISDSFEIVKIVKEDKNGNIKEI